MLIRYKLVFLSLVLVLLGTGCGNEIKKKDGSAKNDSATDLCASSGDNRFFCINTAVNSTALLEACSKDPNSALCGNYKFLYDGYGGVVYPQPVMKFFDDLYSQYVNFYYNRYKEMPETRHFGERFGLLYNDKDDPQSPADIVADQLPVGIVGGSTVTGGDAAGTAYNSESCALCHFGAANDGLYRFGAPNTNLNYGGLKLAFNRFICYAEATGEYADLETTCASNADLSKLSDEKRTQCEAYQAMFYGSPGNSALMSLWQENTIFTDAARKQLLDNVKNSVPGGADTACAAVEKMLPRYSYAQIVELSKWDGVRTASTATATDPLASRIDRFYNTINLADGTQRNIDDGTHAPVKIPLLGNLVSDAAAAAQDYHGQFLGSGVVSSLQHYVRMHAALVGGDNTVAEVQDAALTPLMNFLASLKVPAPDVANSTLTSVEYATGKALVEQRCLGCHTEDQALVPYSSTVATDNAYAFMLNPINDQAILANIEALTPGAWNTPQGLLKTPRLHGLWTYQAFLHNGMSYSIQNLFCLTSTSKTARDAVYASGDLKGQVIYQVPFLDNGHTQTCAADLTDDQREDMIIYLLTL